MTPVIDHTKVTSYGLDGRGSVPSNPLCFKQGKYFKTVINHQQGKIRI